MDIFAVFTFLLISRHSKVASNLVFLHWNRESNTLHLSTHMTHDFEEKNFTSASGRTLKIQNLRHNCEKSWPDWEKRPVIWAYLTKNLPESVEISQTPFCLLPSVISRYMNINPGVIPSPTGIGHLWWFFMFCLFVYLVFT